MRLSRQALACLLLTLVACASVEESGLSTTTSTRVTPTTTTVAPEPSIAPEAAAYLEEALDLMERYSINTARLDWDEIREVAFRVAGAAQTPTQTHSAIITALGMLGDDHSVFLSPSEAGEFSEGEALFVEPEVELLDDGVGYVSVGRYLGDIGPPADDYARELAAALNAVGPDACGWVLDLRQNTGGNMWPMVAGLAPLLGSGVVGYFTYPDGRTETWELDDRAAYWAGELMVRHDSRPEPRTTDGPVAVLIGAFTASSGEATATAFHWRPNSRFFGQPSAGLTTSNEPIFLSDGAMIALTMSVFTDRTGHEFGQDIPIVPDEELAPTDDTLAAAVDWLHGDGGC